MTLSTTEAEFVAAAVCACQAVWVKRILKEIGFSDEGLTIKLSKNSIMHGWYSWIGSSSKTSKVAGSMWSFR